MAININVTATKVTIQNKSTTILNKGEYNINTCTFSFSSEYDNLEKRAIFYSIMGNKYITEIKDNSCIIPYEILGLSGTLVIGVFAYRNNADNTLDLRYSPQPDTITVLDGSYSLDAKTSVAAYEYEDFIAEANTLLNEIQTKLDNGEFNGVGIELIRFNPDYTFTIFLTDGTTYTSPNLKGEPGEPGQDGRDGIDGIDGQDGADGKSAYQIWLEEGNVGTEQDFLDSLKGADGIDGKDGKDGVDGKDGTNGQDGYTPIKGTDYWTTADKAEIVQDTIQDLQPTLSSNLQTAKDYTDNQIARDFKNISYDNTTATFVFTRHDNTTFTVDLPIEQTVKNGYYDDTTEELVLVLVSNQEIRIPASGLIDDYSGQTSATIQVSISADNKITCNIVSGSISKTLLTSELQTEINNKANRSELPTKTSQLTNDSNYVTDTDYVESGKAGIIRLSSGLDASNGYLYLNIYSYENYNNATNGLFIGKGTLENVITGKNLETGNNKVTTISSSSTNTEYPSAKCVYDYIQSLDGDEVSY